MILRGEWRGTGLIRLHVLANRDEMSPQGQTVCVEVQIYNSKRFPIIVSSTTGLSAGVDAPVLNVPARVKIVKNLKVPGNGRATVSLPGTTVPSFKTIRFSVDCVVLCDRDSVQITND